MIKQGGLADAPLSHYRGALLLGEPRGDRAENVFAAKEHLGVSDHSASGVRVGHVGPP